MLTILNYQGTQTRESRWQGFGAQGFDIQGIHADVLKRSNLCPGIVLPKLM